MLLDNYIEWYGIIEGYFWNYDRKDNIYIYMQHQNGDISKSEKWNINTKSSFHYLKYITIYGLVLCAIT